MSVLSSLDLLQLAVASAIALTKRELQIFFPVGMWPKVVPNHFYCFPDKAEGRLIIRLDPHRQAIRSMQSPHDTNASHQKDPYETERQKKFLGNKQDKFVNFLPGLPLEDTDHTAVWSEIYACAIFSLWLHVLAPKSPSRPCDVPGTPQANEGAAPVQACSSQRRALSRSRSISLGNGFNTSMHFQTSDEAMPSNAFWRWDLPSVQRANLPAASPKGARTMSQACRTPSAQRGRTSGQAWSLTQTLTQD